MTAPLDLPEVPPGPFESAPRGGHDFDMQADVLRRVLADAKVETGAYDARIIHWLSQWEWSTVAVIASWVTAANGGAS